MSEKIVLPSIAEIEASTDLLSDPSRSVKVVRVRERFAVKVGTSIAPLEAENMKAKGVAALREPIHRTLSGHKNVFTHADLQPKNVMVEQKGVCEDGSPDYQITLLDWALAGWYPEYWDYCNSTVYCQGKHEWLELVPDIFDEYPVEYLMMRIFYTSMFY
ncbi:hypothetical protein P170DRAFT_465021 [Aspergillus steynii IBT 23096]|uniref:Aminoglycoside phosphotransferase domain-containing protein n=1 Tax=Aspergillus steynii IBT 23096 TaxID=1392250 RepID=A0A2I2G9U7_9EURO|nr:uncharacterized protein P170DRAFT_465021 [Aspergillus steynii IBT 23096]PLB49652.1 hypothetical protein P170DRAFT_465021 [Aspergillus steynii IBT 23096]